MRYVFVVTLLLEFSIPFSGQSPFPSPIPVPTQERTRIKNFGSSLKRFGKKDNEISQDRQNDGSSDNEKVIRVDTDLVVSDILVVNQKGNPMLGLEKRDFVVTEDGVPQNISLFSFGENATLPRSIVLIIDYSGSQTLFIKSSINAARVLVDKLGPQDKMAIVTDDVELLADFTKDKNFLKRKLGDLGDKVRVKSGRSEQYTALVATLNEMFSEKDIRPIIILQSDGDELFALKPTDDKENRPPVDKGWVFGIRQKTFSFEDVYELARKSRATIYSIVPGLRLMGLSEEELFVRTKHVLAANNYGQRPRKEVASWSNWLRKEQMALFDIATLSGGYVDYIEKSEDAENVYSNIFTVINNRYTVGYYPTNDRHDGKLRQIKIEVRSHPEYTVTCRKAYFAPE